MDLTFSINLFHGKKYTKIEKKSCDCKQGRGCNDFVYVEELFYAYFFIFYNKKKKLYFIII